MKANPGGKVAPDEVMGRDGFIERLWSRLDRLGIVLVAERRMGKTSVINKMKSEPQRDWAVFLSDVEAVSHPIEFVERLIQDIEKHLSAKAKAVDWLKRLREAVGGLEVAGVFKLPQASAAHWKTHLERALGDLAQNQRSRVLLIWDELPWMLQKIARKEGQSTIIDLLDVLRSQRQKHDNLRMLYTGSIGLHHIVSELHEEGYASSPVNDMLTVELPPLDHVDAAELAKALLRGEQLQAEPLDECAETIARLVDGVPFYVHHVVAALADRGKSVRPETATDAVAQLLTDPQDPWNMVHYRSRLPQYYGERAQAVRWLLGRLAETSPLGLADLHAELKVGLVPENAACRAIVEGDPERLRLILSNLQRDHYVRRDSKGAFAFRFELIRRWWLLDSGLS